MKMKSLRFLILAGALALTGSTLSQPMPVSWSYLEIDNARQKWGDFDSPGWLRYFGLDDGDINRDGYRDLVSGRYVYLNPGGDMSFPWKRFDLGLNADGYLFTDVDTDVYADIIAEAFPNVYWLEAENRNGTTWKSICIGQLPPTDHVNGQGAMMAQLIPGPKPQLVMATGGGVYAVSLPGVPDSASNWHFKKIIDNGFDEGLCAADFDGDGDLDISTGLMQAGDTVATRVNWYENPGTLNQIWKAHEAGRTLHWTDRFVAADFNGDNWPDIAVSEERYPGNDPDANLYWFQNPGAATDKKWIPHLLLTAYSLNNLDAADVDGDGDMDLVTNEHKGRSHKLFILENDGMGQFAVQVADTGKECHLGTKFVDLDADGDPDLAGHAWDNYPYLHVWRNNTTVKSAPRIPFGMMELSPGVALHPVFCDMNRDGITDLACVNDYVDSNKDDGLHIKTVGYFKGPDMEFIPVHKLNFRSCEMDVADLDGDGYPDIIGRDDTDADDANETGALFWLRNPGNKAASPVEWVRNELGHASYTKDISHGDFDANGRTDVVARAYDGKLHLFFQMEDRWESRIIPIPLHDGMAVSDINNDGSPDVVLNGFWLMAPKHPLTEPWVRQSFDPVWHTQKTGDKGKWWDNNTKVTTHDMNKDGYPDIVISMAETTGWPVCWYENPARTPSGDWKKHVIGYMDYCHSLQVADADNDGDPDVFCAELIPYTDKSTNPYHPVVLFVNAGNSWERQELDAGGCYGGKAGDIDQDGDIDLVGPVNYERGPLKVWLNRTQETKGVQITDQVNYKGISCIRIETPMAVYFYDKSGGGFMSMIDQDGTDWIGFDPAEKSSPGNAATRYRGIPNMIDDEGVGAGHPGLTATVTTVIDHHTIESHSLNGKWKWRWSFTADHTQLTLLAVDPAIPYWFLYEGIPGGRYEPKNLYWGNNVTGYHTGTPDLLKQEAVVSRLEWAYFGHRNSGRILCVKHRPGDEHNDFYSLMGNTRQGLLSPDGMVVFGFGRNTGTVPLLTGINNRLTIGFLNGPVNSPEDHFRVAREIAGKMW